MGSEDGQDVEKPVHRVWVDAFLFAETQVTVSEYSDFLRESAVQPPPFWNDPSFNHPQQPIVAVSWFQAERYCQWLADRLKTPFRLPTEAEWERGARGGVEQTLYPWGNDPPQKKLHYDRRWLNGPERVKQSEPNGFGLYEMCENVHEWCSDWYEPQYYSYSPMQNPKGPSDGIRKSSRGGSWRHHIKISRSSARSSIPPQFQYADYGFRVACDL